jgi:predicted house-cleaning noncanonical NTP pyrophosphatase (MazG superfamily)
MNSNRPSSAAGKLVRDGIPQIIEAAGRTPATRFLDKGELLEALLNKLDEEANELRSATADQRVAELADVLEVVRATAKLMGISFSDLEEIADAKKAERGGFELGVFLEF